MSKQKESNIGPRDYKVTAIKRLFAFSGNKCTKPGCKKKLIAEDGHTVVAKICHIEAAKAGGPRFRQSMSDDERRSFANLILLCDEHHQMIDDKHNEDKYSVELLLDWKENQISLNREDKFELNEKVIENFIKSTLSYYKKIDSLDGPYKPMVSNEYVSRDFEKDLLSILEERKCLLLTGMSFCGKSEMAKNLTLHYFQKDYLYKRVSNIRDASSFLESIGTNRICFLEDPFGHKVGEINPNELKRLQDLLYNLPTNHLLIITSRREVLYSVFNSKNLSECNINNQIWHDITCTDKVFLEMVWHKVSNRGDLKEENINNVNNLLSSNKLLQPGQLTYLAKLPRLKFEILDSGKLYQLAQINAVEIRQSIESIDNFTWKVLLILGLCSDTIHGCSYEDLEYILDSNHKKLSLEPEKEGLSSYLGKDPKDFVSPQYLEGQNKITEFEFGIDLLEDRGYIRLEYGQYIFTHPQYREIAKSFIIGLSTIKQRQLLSFVNNALTCLNPDAAYNTSNNIGFIIENLHQDYVNQMISIIFNVSESSYFPKVLDQCYLYLLQNFRSKEVEQYQSDLSYKLQTPTDNSNIIFVNSQPIKWRVVRSFSHYLISAKTPYTVIIADIKNDIPISPEDIWSALLSIHSMREELDIRFLEYSFKSSEVFIRNLTAYNYFLNISSFHDSVLKDRILIDEQPSVLFYALKGFLQGIPRNSKYINKELTERFLYFFQNDEIFCIRSSNLMTNFSTDYASESIDWKSIDNNRKFWIWRIWAELFISFMSTFPKNVRFTHTPRFSGMMNTAKEFVYPEQSVKIAKNLLKYIEANLKTRVPNNFEMHLIDFLIDATKSKPKIRFTIFKKMITGNYTTTFIGYNLSWAISRWDILESNEKKTILDLLKSNKKDVQWLQAIVVNSCIDVPNEIQEIIFGEKDYLTQSIDEIVKRTPKLLLEKLIVVYSGKDGALQEIGISHSNLIIKKVTIYIATNNLNIKYKTCVALFLSDVLNGVRKERVEQTETDWLEIVKNSSKIDRLVEIVLKQISRTSFIRKDTKNLLKVIIDQYFELNKINSLATLLASHIEELTYTSGDSDVFAILKYRNFMFDYILPLLPRNELLLNLLLRIETGNLNKEEVNHYLKVIVIENEEPIHFRLIFDLIEKIDNRNLLDSETIKVLKSIPNNISKRQKSYFKNEYSSKKLDNFIYFLD